jgi:hypothetical protein
MLARSTTLMTALLLGGYARLPVGGDAAVVRSFL